MNNAIRPPRGNPRRLTRKLLKFLQILKQLIIKAPLLNVVFQQGRIGKLWTAIIHDLVEDLIDEGEFLLYVVLGHVAAEVCLADED